MPSRKASLMQLGARKTFRDNADQGKWVDTPLSRAGRHPSSIRALKRDAANRPADSDGVAAVEAIIGDVRRPGAESGGPFTVGGVENACSDAGEPVTLGSFGRYGELGVPHSIGKLDLRGVPLPDDAFCRLAYEGASQAIGCLESELAVAGLAAEIGRIGHHLVRWVQAGVARVGNLADRGGEGHVSIGAQRDGPVVLDPGGVGVLSGIGDFEGSGHIRAAKSLMNEFAER